jgi:P-type E1-E2 ATPase
MTLRVDIPGRGSLELEHLVLDLNGTLTDRGRLISGVESRLQDLAAAIELHLLSADTFGTLHETGATLGIEARTVASGDQKLAVVRELGPGRCIVVGNGVNDALALEAAALGIAVVGAEGASGAAIRAADIVCRSIVEALDLLLDPRVLAATLRR